MIAFDMSVLGNLCHLSIGNVRLSVVSSYSVLSYYCILEIYWVNEEFICR